MNASTDVISGKLTTVKSFIVVTAGIPPVGIKAEKFTRGDRFTQFYDEVGNEVAWFNTQQIAGMWVVNDSPVIGAVPHAAFVSRKN